MAMEGGTVQTEVSETQTEEIRERAERRLTVMTCVCTCAGMLRNKGISKVN